MRLTCEACGRPARLVQGDENHARSHRDGDELMCESLWLRRSGGRSGGRARSHPGRERRAGATQPRALRSARGDGRKRDGLARSGENGAARGDRRRAGRAAPRSARGRSRDASNDAARLEAAGIPSISITTGNACHLDARMVHRALHRLRVVRARVPLHRERRKPGLPRGLRPGPGGERRACSR